MNRRIVHGPGSGEHRSHDRQDGKSLMEASLFTNNCHPLTSSPDQHFFGYYDICPYDPGERYILALKTPVMARPPRKNETAVLGLVERERGNRFEAIGETTAWNWQQGARAQWLAQGHILYNTRQEGRPVATISRVDGTTVRTLPMPLYALDPTCETGLSVNFSRLHHLRPGYGYAGAGEPPRDPAPSDDGIYSIDLGSGKTQLIISLRTLAESAGVSDPSFIHWVNDLQFNTDGSRFAFLHRWSTGAALRGRIEAWLDRHWSVRQFLGRQTWLKRLLGMQGTNKSVVGLPFNTRLMTAAADGSSLRVVSECDVISHYDWKDERELLAWSICPGQGRGFRRYHDGQGVVEIVGEKSMTHDGHCSYSPNRRFILNDTYPDARGVQHLYIYDTLSDKRIDIAEVPSVPHLRGPVRCDLHPRWSPSGRWICFDATPDGTRQVYEYDLVQAGII